MSQQSSVMRKTRNATTNEQDIQSNFKCEMWAVFFIASKLTGRQRFNKT